ncbi:MAG: glycosyltransferase [Clostridia bacterium]|nr:glycosyltransferase [Clostridia bacterium]
MKISVCIPMYNEAAIIAENAQKLWAYMEENFVTPEGERDYEIIYSNDGSKDGCDKIVESLGLPGIKVVGYENNKGKGYAVKTAMLASVGDIVMFTDADLAYGTDVITQMVDTFDANPDSQLVIGSRNLSEDGYSNYTLIRKIASKVYIKVLCIVGGFKLSDSQCGCKGFRRQAVDQIFPRLEVNGFAFDFEALLWASKFKYKITEMPVSIKVHGESKVRIVRDTLKMLRDILRMKKRINKVKI